MKKTTKEIDKMTNMLTNFIIQHSDVKREDADIIAFGVHTKFGECTRHLRIDVNVLPSADGCGINCLQFFVGRPAAAREP